MRFTALFALLGTALLAGCCGSNHCADSCGSQPACCAPGGYGGYAGGQMLPQPVPDTAPPMEPADEAPLPPNEG